MARSLVKETDAKKSGAQWMPFVKGIPLIAVVVPFVFWLEFGHVGAFAIAFTAGLVLLLALIAFGLWNLERTEAKNRRGRP